MDQSVVSYDEWNAKYSAFLMASRILEMVESSEDAARMTIQDVTIEESRELCRRACGLTPQDEHPLYVSVAEEHVLSLIDAARGKTLDWLVEPMRRIRTELWPLLRLLVADHEAKLQAYWQDPPVHVDRELHRLAHKTPEEVRSTVSAFVQILRTIGALPTRSSKQVAQSDQPCAVWGQGVEVTHNASADRVETRVARTTADVNSQASAIGDDSRSRKRAKLEWEALAIFLVREHPDWSNARIAREVGRDPSRLSRSKLYQAAAKQARAPDIPAGRLITDSESGLRDVEAYSDADDPAKRDWGSL